MEEHAARRPYRELYEWARQEPEAFWGEAAAALEWVRPPTRIAEPVEDGCCRWYPDGALNTCWNALDRHIKAGRGDQAALIWDSPLAGDCRTLTYASLLDEVGRCAGALASFGVERGDRVVIYMPMVPETVVAMLACARLGAIHSVVFGGFASHELAVRIDDARPKLVIAASCGLEPGRVVPYKPLLDRALAQAAHKVAAALILQRPQAEAALVPGRDHDWHAALASARPVDCVAVAATEPLYVLYTSGTTGKPKGIVRDNGGHAAALLWSMRHIYDVALGEVFWAASDVGWVVGHSYIVYGPLLNGNTTVLYEGKPVGTPDPGAFWRVVEAHRVAALFTAPTAFRAIRKEDPDARHLARYDLGSLRALFLAGERCDPDTLRWAESKLGVPVIDHWWQTETGWAICANPIGIQRLPVKPGSPTLPMPGYDVHILDEAGHEVPEGRMGAICLRLPLPPGCLPSLWNAPERFREAYLERHPGFYITGDAGFRDADGYVFVMGRNDDVINVAGHRLSTGAIEEVLASHPAVAECAVIGVFDAVKGEVPLGLAVLKSGVAQAAEEIERELVTRVRDEIGPVAAFKLVAVVKRLPKTRSGKVLRGTMKKIADKAHFSVPPTIDDPAILDEIALALARLGYAEARSGPAPDPGQLTVNS